MKLLRNEKISTFHSFDYKLCIYEILFLFFLWRESDEIVKK